MGFRFQEPLYSSSVSLLLYICLSVLLLMHVLLLVFVASSMKIVNRNTAVVSSLLLSTASNTLFEP